MRYEKWSPGYWLLKQYVRFAFWIFHGKIIITGKEKIPKGKPLIFTPNHQNALIDPLAVLLYVPYQPLWLARADIFNKSKITDAILKFLKIIPVYRLRDGKENLEKNEFTFDTSIRVLENNGALALFPEGAHSFKNQMIVHKKAVPRIAFLAEEQSKSDLDTVIIPTGLFYSHFLKLNRKIIVNFGDPISVKDFSNDLYDNLNKRTIALKNAVNDGILPLVINIFSKKYYEEFERIRSQLGKAVWLQRDNNIKSRGRFYSDQLLTAHLDDLEKNDSEQTELLINKANKYIFRLNSLKLNLETFNPDEPLFLAIVRPVGQLTLLIIGLPFFILGSVINITPLLIIDHLVRKKVKDTSFRNSFAFVAGIVLFPLFYILAGVVIFLFVHSILMVIISILMMPFLGKISLKWHFLWVKSGSSFRWVLKRVLKPQLFTELIKEGRDLIKQLIGEKNL